MKSEIIRTKSSHPSKREIGEKKAEFVKIKDHIYKSVIILQDNNNHLKNILKDMKNSKFYKFALNYEGLN